MIIYSSKDFGNAEITVDYEKKTVDFVTANKNYSDKDRRLSFFLNNYYFLVGNVFMSFFLYIYSDIFHPYRELISWYGIYPIVYIVLVVCFFCSIILFSHLLLGYTSIVVHTLSKTARKNFSETNAILCCLNGKHKIVLNPDRPYYKSGFITDNNKLILTKYDIAKFVYTYIGDNPIVKIETKSVEDDDKKGEHYEFIAIVTFREPIKDGIFIYQ